MPARALGGPANHVNHTVHINHHMTTYHDHITNMNLHTYNSHRNNTHLI